MKPTKNPYGIISVLIFLSAIIVISGCIGGSAPGAADKTKMQSEIQEVLDEQCDAIKNKDIDALMATFDKESSERYDEMKTGWEMAFLEVNVTGCKMIITDLRINDDPVMVELEGTMTSVLLPGGETKTENFTETDKFKKVGSGWKQVY
jgi:hypothetical protein